MKKIFVISLIALFMAMTFGCEAFAVNPSGPGYPGDTMGMASGRYASDAHRTFRLVRSRAAATITADSMVVWDTDVAYPTASDGVTVTTTTTSGDSRVAGMLITTIISRDTLGGGYTATEDVGQKNWGWLQTYGKSALKAITCPTGLITAGHAICAGPTWPGSVSGFIPSATNPAVQGNAGFAMETTAVNGEGYIFLKCE